MNQASKLLSILAATLLITACGGGGGGSSDTVPSSTSGSQATAPVTPPTSSGSSTSTTPSAPATAHTLQLSWTIPTTRENGVALSIGELSGYQIYYYADGSASGSGEVVNISGGSTNSAQITITGSGTYYFAIAARDQAGLLSNLSGYVPVALN